MSVGLFKFAVLPAALAMLAASSAYATPLNTGVDSTGALLAPGATDGAWTGQDVTGAPVSVTPYAVSGYFGAWLTDPAAEFISPLVDGNGQAGNYAQFADINWTQTFTLTSNEAASDILGRFAVDNALLGLVVNGTLVTGVGAGGFNSFTSFDIPSADLLVGANTITFETQNFAGASGNPTGLLVEFTQIPEPASLAVMGVGLATLLAFRKRNASVT